MGVNRVTRIVLQRAGRFTGRSGHLWWAVCTGRMPGAAVPHDGTGQIRSVTMRGRYHEAMLYAEHVARTFGSLDVLKDVTFTVSEGERAGLVGPNGAGKSTLLRLIAGEDAPDEGSCGHRGGTLGYLRQEAGHDADRRLIDEMWTAFPEARAIDLELQDTAGQIERGEGDLDVLIDEQGRLFEAYEAMDGYRIDTRIGRVLDGLGFAPADREKLCGEFSGGWQMRIALAKILVRRPEHMLLDEPTNHLDVAAKDWLADDLSKYKGVVLIVTHDAEFLDRVANRIIELRDGAVETYTGNYTEYQQQKAARLQQLDRAAARQDRELEKQERFIERFRAKSSKATAVKSREKAVAKIERIERPRKEAEVHFQLTAHGRTERDVLMLCEISHTYGDHVVLVDVNLHVERGQKVVLIGPNGSGKSTLLRIAAGMIDPTEGSVDWAERARRQYYDQHQDEVLDRENTVLAEVRSVAANESDERLRTVLGQFLFRGDDVFKKISVLSGGERSRVALAKFLIQPTNVLVLDEPTNHLDRTTRRKLIEALEKYEGTIICASHDPGILDRVATRVYEVKDGGCREVIERRRELD
jgi:ATP-binding cassette subfamily F protein 3